MADEPPAQLVDLLVRLGIATREQICTVAPRARRLAHDLPLFDSVWLDALVQDRVLTPFQAAEILAGRGERLRVGPYVIKSRRGPPIGYAETYAAVQTETQREANLLVKRDLPQNSIDAASASLRTTITAFDSWRAERQKADRSQSTSDDSKPPGQESRTKLSKPASRVAAVEDAGADGTSVWVAYQPSNGIGIAQWLAWHGRISSDLILEIARQMVESLAELELAGIAHGDIATSALLINGHGGIELTRCAARSALRPTRIHRTMIFRWKFLTTAHQSG